MILESIYKYRDMIFTFVEMLFLTYLLKGTGHDIKVRDYKKRILQVRWIRLRMQRSARLLQKRSRGRPS